MIANLHLSKMAKGLRASGVTVLIPRGISVSSMIKIKMICGDGLKSSIGPYTMVLVNT